MSKFRGVLIGLVIEVEDSHLKGEVVDESKHTLSIKTQNAEKKIIKEQHTFIINNTRIDGQQLVGRPEERIKIR